jgi:uncharacterized metal-binding protein YceD (DUF177 family)
MKALIAYEIPFSGLKNGTHYFDFEVDKDFFKNFDDSLITESTFKVNLAFDKQPSMFVLDFSFEGTFETVCDRCVESFDLPIKGKQHFIVKMRSEVGEEEEIIYIKDIETDLNVAPIIYEVLHLNLPLKRACALDNDDQPSCGFDMSDFSLEEEYDDIEDENPEDIWSALKDFNKKT